MYRKELVQCLTQYVQNTQCIKGGGKKVLYRHLLFSAPHLKNTIQAMYNV